MIPVKDLYNDRKYLGRSKGRVIDNRDPKQRGRIIVDHPILGQTVWIDYLRSPGNFSVPSIGDIVYVECDTGVYEYPFAWGNVTKGLDENPEIPNTFKRDVPTNRGLHTPNGHFIELDDGKAELTNAPEDTNFTTEGRGIKVTSTAGNKIHIVEDTDAEQEYILLETTNGNFIKLDYKEDKLSINVLKDTQFDTAENRTDNIGGDLTQTVGSDLTIDVTGDVTINCSNVTVTASGDATVDAGGAGNLITGGDATVDSSGKIILQSPSNSAAPGGAVTANAINNDPITGIPLTPAGGTDII